MEHKILVIGPMKISSKEWDYIQKTKWKKVVLIDGGDHHLNKLKHKIPNALFTRLLHFGDGDSSRIMPQMFKKNQNLSDLAFYLTKLKNQKNLGSVTFFGFLGGRYDHLMFNFGAWLQSIESANYFMIGSDMMLMKKGRYLFNLKGTFSLFSFQKNSIKLTGECRYPLPSWTTLSPLDSRTLSNEANGKFILSTKSSLILYKKNLLWKKL